MTVLPPLSRSSLLPASSSDAWWRIWRSIWVLTMLPLAVRPVISVSPLLRV
jgi:hypothetical protein